MSQFRRNVMIAIASALIMSVAGAAVGLSSASTVAHPAKAKRRSEVPEALEALEDRRDPRDRGVGGAGGAGRAGGLGRPGRPGRADRHGRGLVRGHRVDAPGRHDRHEVYGNDGLEIDVACTANPTATANCGLFAEGVSGTAQTLSYQGFGPGGTTPISASIAQLGQYTANGAAGITAMPPNGVQMIGADSLSGSAHGGGQVTFSFSSQPGRSSRARSASASAACTAIRPPRRQ